MTSLAYTLAIRATHILGGNWGQRGLVSDERIEDAIAQATRAFPLATSEDRTGALRVTKELFAAPSVPPDRSALIYEDVRFKLYGTPEVDDAYYFQADE